MGFLVAFAVPFADPFLATELAKKRTVLVLYGLEGIIDFAGVVVAGHLGAALSHLANCRHPRIGRLKLEIA